MTRPPRDPHLDELLAEAALFRLTGEQREELGQLVDEDVTYELAAAAADLATLRQEPIPGDVLARLQRTAVAEQAPPPARPRAAHAIQSGWIAAAACLLLAAGGWWSYATKVVAPVTVDRVVERVVTGPPPVVPPPKDLPTQRAELLARAADAVTLPWSPTKDASGVGVSGDVVWSEAEQKGFMRFRGLATNDPAKLQYQLWVFDAAQEHPIDGGVFDVSAVGEVTVPITAKLHVRVPSLFAVTVEKPGGVVVSKREHIVVTAATKAG